MGLDTRLQTKPGIQIGLQFRDSFDERNQLGINSLLVFLLLLWNVVLLTLSSQSTTLG